MEHSLKWARRTRKVSYESNAQWSSYCSNVPTPCLDCRDHILDTLPFRLSPNTPLPQYPPPHP